MNSQLTYLTGLEQTADLRRAAARQNLLAGARAPSTRAPRERTARATRILVALRSRPKVA